MKRLFVLFLCLSPLPASAGPSFRYFTNCILESRGIYTEDVCTVVETRAKGGALQTRNVYSNRFGLTVKSRFDKEKGFVTWDSHNKFEYKWEYKVGTYQGLQPYTYIMPGLMLEDVSWD